MPARTKTYTEGDPVVLCSECETPVKKSQGGMMVPSTTLNERGKYGIEYGIHHECLVKKQEKSHASDKRQ